jgi:hypothetical protein
MLREFDRDSQHQFVFLAFFGALMPYWLGPNPETSTVVALQSTNLGEAQSVLVPNPGVDNDFNFIRIQRIRIILIELDSTIGKWTMGVEEKIAIRERKLEGGVRGVLWSVRGSVRMMRFVGMARFVGVTGLVGMSRFVGMIRLIWMIGTVRRIRFVWMVRMMRRPGFIGVMGFAMMLARVLDLLRLGPIGILITFQVLVGIKSSRYETIGDSAREFIEVGKVGGLDVMQLVAFVMELDRRSPEPIEEGTDNEEMAGSTDHLPAPGPLLEAAAFAALLLLRGIDRELRVGLFVIF